MRIGRSQRSFNFLRQKWRFVLSIRGDLFLFICVVIGASLGAYFYDPDSFDISFVLRAAFGAGVFLVLRLAWKRYVPKG